MNVLVLMGTGLTAAACCLAFHLSEPEHEEPERSQSGPVNERKRFAPRKDEVGVVSNLPRREDRENLSLASRMKARTIQVTVGGCVAEPGPVSVSRRQSIRDAIQSAGGATAFGSMKRVRLVRGGKLGQFDLTDADGAPIVLEANDTIEVPQKPFFDR